MRNILISIVFEFFAQLGIDNKSLLFIISTNISKLKNLVKKLILKMFKNKKNIYIKKVTRILI